MSSSALSIKNVYFSFSGRASRDHFWFLHALPTAATLTTFFMLSDDVAQAESWLVGGMFTLLKFTLFAALVWICLAVQIKRYHDKNSTGWWVFINVIPGLGAIWAMIENGMMAGDASANTYGPPPTNDRVQVAAAGIAITVIGSALIYWIIQIGCTLETLSLAYGWWE